MAIPMPIVQDIRRLDRQGMSRAQIARRLHVDRGTVAKYADMEDCSPKPKADRRYGSKIDPYAHLVDGWLEADRLLPRKQRHTIRRVHDRLLAETDYDGEYSTTMRYVHRWREANRGVPDREGYVPDDIRAWLDSMDEKTLRESLKAIGDACRAAGFDPAMQACGEILRSNRDMGLHADSLTPIALRMRDGEWEYPGGIEEPDLSGYDRFITGTDDGGEER